MSNQITSTIEVITPEIAEEYLRKNLHNRSMRKSTIAKYADVIRRGEWIMNGQSIAFDINNVILDGQHRLQAIVEAGMPITTVVIRGLPPEAFDTIDIGLQRTNADSLAMEGYKNTSRLANSLSILHHYYDGRIGELNNRTSPTPTQCLALASKHQGVVESIKLADRMPNRSIFTVSTAAACHYIFSEIDPELANDFIYKVYTGVDLEDGNPILALRNKLIDNSHNIRKLHRVFLMAYSFKTWNALKEGRQVKILKWNPQTNPPEDFPILAK